MTRALGWETKALLQKEPMDGIQFVTDDKGRKTAWG